MIKESHLFAGIGDGIYGGHIGVNQCCASVEIDGFCKQILRQRQVNGWMNTLDLFEYIENENLRNVLE